MGLLGGGRVHSPRTDKLMLKWLALSALSGHSRHPMNSPTYFAAEFGKPRDEGISSQVLFCAWTPGRVSARPGLEQHVRVCLPSFNEPQSGVKLAGCVALEGL